MDTIISSTEVARHLGDVPARVKHGGETFLVTKSDKPLARLIPVGPTSRATGAALAKALSRLPYDPDFAGDLERVNRRDRVPENPCEAHFRQVADLEVHTLRGVAHRTGKRGKP